MKRELRVTCRQLSMWAASLLKQLDACHGIGDTGKAPDSRLLASQFSSEKSRQRRLLATNPAEVKADRTL